MPLLLVRLWRTNTGGGMMRTIGVVTVARSDYGASLPILRRLQADSAFRLHVIAAGMHLSPEFGLTAKTIEEDGFPIGERVEMLSSSDTPEGIATSMGRGLQGFARSFARIRPDLVVVFGDRFEMHAAALAALPFAIPVAHIAGGELTEGAMDDALRHSMTKLSHLHFVATEAYAKRVLQLGEAPWRVIVSGAPQLDTIVQTTLMSQEELGRVFGLRVDPRPLLVTYHPVTLEHEQTAWQVEELLEALRAAQQPVVFTMPNADTSHRVISRLIEAFVRRHALAQFTPNLGTRGYLSMMRAAAAMVGNSSSGIIEAPSFELPVVNIGTRQQGRIRAENVIDVGYRREQILEGIRQALSPQFRARLRGVVNPYGDGHAAQRIVERLTTVALDARLIQKRFVDIVQPSTSLPMETPAAAHVA